MKKSELKTGMVVTCRNGVVRLIFGKTAMGIKPHGGVTFDNIRDDLTCDYSEDNDIVEVYDEPKGDLAAGFEYFFGTEGYIREYCNILWDRTEDIHEGDFVEIIDSYEGGYFGFKKGDIGVVDSISWGDGYHVFVPGRESTSRFVPNVVFGKKNLKRSTQKAYDAQHNASVCTLDGVDYSESTLRSLIKKATS